jgi:hypothetical protein
MPATTTTTVPVHLRDLTKKLASGRTITPNKSATDCRIFDASGKALAYVTPKKGDTIRLDAKLAEGTWSRLTIATAADVKKGQAILARIEKARTA